MASSSYFYEFLGRVNQYILNPLILLMFAIALIVFFWGLVQFIHNAETPAARETGKQHMMYGIVGMLVMVGVYGLIALVLNTFGLQVPDYIS